MKEQNYAGMYSQPLNKNHFILRGYVEAFNLKVVNLIDHINESSKNSPFEIIILARIDFSNQT